MTYACGSSWRADQLRVSPACQQIELLRILLARCATTLDAMAETLTHSQYDTSELQSMSREVRITLNMNERNND